MTPRPGMRGSESQDEERRQRRGLLAWFVLVLFSICILFACAQIAGLSIFNPPQSVDLRSNMQADYSPWGYVAFGPINPQILLDILDDLNLDQLQIPVISDSCLIPGSCPTATATPEPTQTDTPTITLTPSETPTPSQTPTITNTFTLTPTATKTPTPTPLVYPVKLANPDKVDPELTQNVRFTILVINYGSLPPAQLQTVCDFLPTGLTYVAGSADRGGTYGTCPGVGGTAIVWTPNESIPQGAFSRFTFQARSDHPVAGDSFDNRVTAFGGNFNAATNHKSVYAYTPTPTPTETTQPITAPDLYSADEDTNINPGALAGVLANDSDAPWDILQSYVVVGPTYGDLTLNTDGSFNYQTTPDWNGYDSFVYEACDQGGACSTAAVTLAVTPVPDTARATDDIYSVNEDNSLSVPAAGVITNDVDPDNFLPTAANFGLVVVTPMPVATPIHGAVTVQADGAFDYFPAPDYFGGDVFTYRVCDADGCDLGDAHITVVPVDDAPVAVDDAATTNEDTYVDIPVIAGDGSGDGRDTDIDNTNAQLSVQPGSISNVQGGAAVLLGDGRTVRFTPSLNLNNFNTASFGFDYRAYDGTLPSAASAHVTISVLPIDDTPVPANDIYATPFSQFGGPYTLYVLANDSDPVESDPLHIESVPSAPNNPAVIATPAMDAIIYDPNPTGTTTPFHSPTTPDTFTYRVCDEDYESGSLQTACATAQVSLLVNDAPVAVDDDPDPGPSATPAAGNLVVYEDTTLNVSAADGVLSNDYDPNIPATDTLTAILDSGPSHAAPSPVFTLNADGSFIYRPELNYNSSIDGNDSFTYHVSDGGLTSGTATVTIHILPVNDAPVANFDPIATPPSAADPDPDLYIVDTGNTLAVSAANGVLANDSDVDNLLPTPANAGLSAVLDAGPSNAAPGPSSFTLNADGSFDYTPRVNPTPFYGDDQFSYYANDGTADSTLPATVTIHVNGPPVANDDGDPTPIDVTESTATSIDVLANDTDPNPADVLTVGSVSDGAHGTVTNNGSNVTYTPDSYYYGPDSFTYLANDGRLPSDPTSPATVYVYVTPVESPPVAVDDGSAGSPLVTMDEDTSSPPDILTSILLANDTDPDNLTAPYNAGLFVQSVSSGPKDTVVLNDNGTPGDPSDDFVTYTPDANANGADTFDYEVCDPTARCDTGTVTVQVNPVNDPPTANDFTVRTTEDTARMVDVLAHATDPDLGDTPPDVLTLTFVGAPDQGGSAILNDNGTAGVPSDDYVDYQPASGYSSPTTPEHFTFTVCDAGSPAPQYCDTGTVSVIVNDAPTAYDDPVGPTINDPPASAYQMDEDSGTLPVSTADGVLANDVDPNNASAPFNAGLTAGLVADVSNGNLTLAPDGSFTYQPDLNFNGTDSFTYRATDGDLTSNLATVTITVNAVNDAPVAVDDGTYNTYDVGGYLEANPPIAPIEVAAPGVLANDSDVDGATPPPTAQLVTFPGHYTAFTLTPDGSFSYNAEDGYTGDDSFTYRACDSLGACSAPATVSFYVDALPVTNNDGYSLAEDGTLTVDASDDPTAPVGVLFNDTDANGDPLTAHLVPASGPSHAASFSLSSNGSFSYQPEADWNGTDSFEYYANDGDFDSTVDPTVGPATVTITVTAVNDPPRPGNDSYSLDEDTTLTVDASDDPAPPLGLMANDIEPDGQPMAVTTTAVSGPSHAQMFTLSADGSFTYRPVANYHGPDSFVYQVCDDTFPTPLCDSGTVSLTINNVNDQPVGSDDPATPGDYTINEDSTLNVTSPGVLGNDSDPDNFSPTPAYAGLTASLVNDVTNGSLSLYSDGSFTYSPDPNYYGTDSFTYQACDSGGLCTADITASIIINAIPDAPVANNDPGTGPTPPASAYQIDEDGGALAVSATDGVLANDNDPDNLTAPVNFGLTAVLDSGPTHDVTPGGFILNADGSFNYTPEANFNGTDSFTYHAFDGGLASASATVTITVNSIDDPPSAVDDTAATTEDNSVDIDVAANDTDIDNPNGDLQVAPGTITNVHGGSILLLGDNRTVRFTPAGNANDGNTAGGFGFDYQVSDGTLTSANTGTVTISVSAVNDPPVAANDSYTIGQSAAPSQLLVLSNDSDPVEGNVVTIASADGTSAHGASIVVHTGGDYLTYAQTSGYHSPTVPDTFSYTACDDGPPPPASACDTATVSVIVNDAPTASPDSYSLDEDTSLSVPIDGVLSNDSDPNTGPVDTIMAVLDTNPGHAATFNLNANGSFSYTPVSNWNGTDSFTYHATDGGMDSGSVTVTLTVNPVNDAPVANPDDAGTIDQGAATVTDVLGNDSDQEGRLDPSTVTVTTPPARGSTSVDSSTGAITFTDAAAGGPQTQLTYTYQVCDANTDLADGPPGQLCDSATVTIHFNRPQLTVQLDPDSQTASRNEIVTFTVSYWNDGPGTAYGTAVTVSAGSGCNVITSNPIFSGNLAELGAAFKDVRVRAPNAEGATCSVTASISSANGTSDSDTSTIDVPAPLAASGALSIAPENTTPTLGSNGGGGDAGAASPTPTTTGTPVTASATPDNGGATATETAVASATVDPDATPADTPAAASATPEGGGAGTDTPVQASATAEQGSPTATTDSGGRASDTPVAASSTPGGGSPADTAVPATPDATGGSGATDTPVPSAAGDPAPPPASPSDTPNPEPTATEQPVAASSAGPTNLSGSGLWSWLQLLLPLAWLGWMLGLRKERKGQDGS